MRCSRLALVAEPAAGTSGRKELKVEIGSQEEAEEIFSRLMGDLVEPRRQFIEENALNVKNLDI